MIQKGFKKQFALGNHSPASKCFASPCWYKSSTNVGEAKLSFSPTAHNKRIYSSRRSKSHLAMKLNTCSSTLNFTRSSTFSLSSTSLFITRLVCKIWLEQAHETLACSIFRERPSTTLRLFPLTTFEITTIFTAPPHFNQCFDSSHKLYFNNNYPSPLFPVQISKTL